MAKPENCHYESGKIVWGKALLIISSFKKAIRERTVRELIWVSCPKPSERAIASKNVVTDN